MKTLMLAVACVLARVLFAASTWIGGPTVSGTDWSDGTKWEGGAPEAGSEVIFPSAVTATVTDSEGALVASFGKIRLNDAGAKIVFNLAADLVCPAMIQGAGSLAKYGAGVLTFSGYAADGTVWLPNGGYGNYNLLGGFDVFEGGLAAPQNTYTQATYGHVRLAKDAVFYANALGVTTVGGIEGEGLVTNVCETKDQVLNVGFPDRKDACEFKGAIGGRINLVAACDLLLSGTNNTFTGSVKARGGSVGGVGGSVGFTVAGTVAGIPSSIGTASDMTPYEGGVFRYAGSGGERTQKRIMFQQDAVSPMTIDAGLFGGLDFAGEWFIAPFPECNVMSELILSGSNTTAACTFSGKYRAGVADAAGNPVSTRITKKGPGIWRLAEHPERLNCGVIEVDEGRLQYESVGEKGEVCALGLSTVLGGRYYGPWDESKRVDHAIELDGADAVFEFVGSNTCGTATRPIGIVSAGHVRASGTDSASVKFDGAWPLPGDAEKRTLVLDGDSAAENYMGGVTGAISVVKSGAGTWTLRGNQTFTGDLVVNEGILKVEKRKPFTWFRMTITSAGNASATLRKIGFYDEDGKMINLGITWSKPRVHQYIHGGTTPTTSESGYVWRNLEPGHATYGRSDYGLNQSTFDSLFTTGGSASLAQYGKTPPEPGDETTWCPLVFRMPEGVKPAVAFDFAPFASGGSYNSVKAYILEGSSDGEHWSVVAQDDKFDYSHTTSNNGQWIYTKEMSASGNLASLQVPRLLADGETKALEFTCETNDYSVLENVGAITVAPGATLKAEGDFTPTITRLGVSATAGAGTIDGFALADGATVEVVGDYPGGAFTVPVSFAGLKNVSTATGLTLKVNGKTKSGALTLTESSLTFVPAGLMLIFR